MRELADGGAAWPDAARCRRRSRRRWPKAMAAAGEPIARVTGKPPLLPKGQLLFLLWNAAPDSSKAQRELGWQPTPIEDGLRATLASMGLGRRREVDLPTNASEVDLGAASGRARRRGRAADSTTSASAATTRSTCAVGQLGEERQRERARGDVLADGELALAVAEALAVEAHQVDRRQVGLGVDAARAQRADRRVAVDAARAAGRRRRTSRGASPPASGHGSSSPSTPASASL